MISELSFLLTFQVAFRHNASPLREHQGSIPNLTLKSSKGCRIYNGGFKRPDRRATRIKVGARHSVRTVGWKQDIPFNYNPAQFWHNKRLIRGSVVSDNLQPMSQRQKEITFLKNLIVSE